MFNRDLLRVRCHEATARLRSLVIACLLAASLVVPSVASAAPETPPAGAPAAVSDAGRAFKNAYPSLPAGAMVQQTQSRCWFKNFHGALINGCLSVALECVGPFCVPTGADLWLSQRTLKSGQAAAPLIAAASIALFPILGPVQSVITGALSASWGLMLAFSEHNCGSHGAGISIGFPFGDSVHC